MLQIGLIGVTIGILSFIWGVMQKLKAGRVADAPLASTGDVVQKGPGVAGPRGQISAQGAVTCPSPLIAPFSGTPCLYYEIKCTAAWKEGNTDKSKTLDEQKVAAQFSIDDGSGPVWVDAREGGDFEPTTTKRETKGAGLLGGITGADVMFGNYRVQTGLLSLGTKYTVIEEVMPMVPRLYACGKLADQGGAIGSPSWRQLLLSAKSRDELLAHATKSAKMFLIGGAAAFVVGSGLSVTAQLLKGPDEATATTTTTTATVAAKNGSLKSAAPTDNAPSDTATSTTTIRTAPTAAVPAVTARPTSGPAKGPSTASAKPVAKLPDAGAPKASPSPTPSAKK